MIHSVTFSTHERSNTLYQNESNGRIFCPSFLSSPPMLHSACCQVACLQNVKPPPYSGEFDALLVTLCWAAMPTGQAALYRWLPHLWRKSLHDSKPAMARRICWMAHFKQACYLVSIQDVSSSHCSLNTEIDMKWYNDLMQ